MSMPTIHSPTVLPVFIKKSLRKLFSARIPVMGAALFSALPIVIVLSRFIHPEPEIWQHIVDTLLLRLLGNTVMLSLGVVGFTTVVGTGAAWLVSVYDFPGRRFFSWALMLPLAIPTYVFAFVFLGLLDFSGPVQTFFRSALPHAGRWFPDIRSTPGVIGVLSLALYPYVYLLARNAFRSQGIRILEASAILGLGSGRALFKVALPMARPWIMAGAMLVLMETLSDFGAVSIFNFDTLTTAIYKAWFGFFSLNAAAQLSSILLILVFGVILMEQWTRRGIQYHQGGRVAPSTRRLPLTGPKKWTAALVLLLLFTAGFIVPFAQLAFWALEDLSLSMVSTHLTLMGHSFFFAAIVAACVSATALFLVYHQRHHRDRTTTWFIRMATMGYAMPGTILAVGFVIMTALLDRMAGYLLTTVTGNAWSGILQGTVFMVIAGCSVRFMTVGFNSISSAMERITPHVDEAAATLGVTGMKRLAAVHLPLLKSGMLTGLILVFVDVMKEMPITLMTRPFGWDTLAVKIFELTSEGEWQRAALPAMVLVLAGMVPLIMLTRKSE